MINSNCEVLFVLAKKINKKLLIKKLRGKHRISLRCSLWHIKLSMFYLFDLSHSDYIVSLNWILHISHMKFTFFDLLFNLFLYHYCYYLFTLFLCNRREWKEILRKLLVRLLGYWVTKNIVSHILNLKEIKLKGKSEFLIWAVFKVSFILKFKHFVPTVGIIEL